MAYIFSSAALLAAVAGFFYLRAYVKKRTTIERVPAQTREAVDLILNDIDRVTDRDSLLVEERVRALREILAEVDKRIRILNKELAAQRPTVAAASPPPPQAAAYNARGEGYKPAEGAQTPPQEQPGVAELAARGLPAAAIAARLGKPLAAVEMEIFVGQRKNK
ncbi:MAG: hypothetical protein LBG74_08510 [Spirochaetaceae bacterium]|jgi:hypothetical protein|nr:hypothetical protein [Spirochaetaceae bacterium]